MTIEVRQLLIRSQVGERAAAPAPGSAALARELERAKAQILAECKAYLREQLRAARER
jgi:Family of unknown function (DUF5908)